LHNIGLAVNIRTETEEQFTGGNLMTAKRMRLLTAGLAIIALIAALFVINPGLGRSAAAAWDGNSRREL